MKTLKRPLEDRSADPPAKKRRLNEESADSKMEEATITSTVTVSKLLESFDQEIVILDFDETLTQSDTTFKMFSLCPPERQQWWKLNFMKEAQEIKKMTAQALGSLQSLEEPWTAEMVATCLKDKDEFDKTLLKRLQDHEQNVFEGFNRGSLINAGREVRSGGLRPGVVDALTHLKENSIPIYVVSANFSKDLIFGALDGLVDRVNIYSCDFTFGDSKDDDVAAVSTREFDSSVASSQDKLEIVKQILSENNITASKCMFVGDSLSDLQAIIHVGCGVLIKTERSSHDDWETVRGCKCVSVHCVETWENDI